MNGCATPPPRASCPAAVQMPQSPSPPPPPPPRQSRRCPDRRSSPRPPSGGALLRPFPPHPPLRVRQCFLFHVARSKSPPQLQCGSSSRSLLVLSALRSALRHPGNRDIHRMRGAHVQLLKARL